MTNWPWRPSSFLLVGIALALLAVSCTGGKTAEVKAGLKEWSITPDVLQAKPGKITFAAANNGTRPHEFVIIKSDLAVEALPIVDDKVDESKLNVISHVHTFGAGKTEKETVDLKPGKYILICNIVERVPGDVQSHYQLGMRASLTVN